MANENAPWVDGLTIGQVLRETVVKYADSDAMVFPQLAWRACWREFGAQVENVASSLLAMGIEPGQHVAIWATNVPEWVLLQFATAKIGAVLVTINPAYRAYELQFVLSQCDAVALFMIDRFKSSNYHQMLNEVCPELAYSVPGNLNSSRFPALKSVVSIRGSVPTGATAWTEMLKAGSQVPPEKIHAIECSIRPDEPINIQYTSGTTGFPKAAMLSHRNLLLNAYYVGARQQFSHRDRVCIPVPFYHCFGCVLGTLCCAIHGATMVIPGEYFQASETLHAIEQEQATVIYGVPTMFIAELQDPSFPSRNLTSLRTGIMAGSPCPIEVMKQVIHRMGASEITIAYGQTEASPVVTQTDIDDPLELRVETVGRPIPGVEAKIVDPQTGETLGEEQQGELCSRGHGVMLGYYKCSVETASTIDPDGWLHSGDLAVRISSGHYKITGRLKDMVIRGGENIFPREIEEFLFLHPAIEQSAVVGVPDEKFGEELCAWIKLKSGAKATDEEIQGFCRDKLAHFKVPRYIRFVDSFPQTVTGKIQKFRIREIMEQELAANTRN